MICAELCNQMPFAAMVKPHETLALQLRVWVAADLQSPFVFLTVRETTAKISPSHFTSGYFRFQDTPSVRAATGLSPKQQVQLQPCLCKKIKSTLPESQRCSELSVPQFPLPSGKRMWFPIAICEIYFRSLTQSVQASDLCKPSDSQVGAARQCEQSTTGS